MNGTKLGSDKTGRSSQSGQPPWQTDADDADEFLTTHAIADDALAEEPSCERAKAAERLPRRSERPHHTTIGRYVIQRLLGRGGMGEVYKAYDPELDRQIAVKLMAVGASLGEGQQRSRTRLLREAQALAQLSHPNVVAVHDVGTFGTGVFIAMELVEGTTLKAWLADQQPTLRQVLDVLLAAGEGLAAAHRSGLVHRDFKPSNVMVGDDGRVRVLDFGLARAAGVLSPVEGESPGIDDVETAVGDGPRVDGETGDRLLSSPLTKAGAVVGTPAYMAPEQHLGGEVDARSDQFSFCMVLYEALCGKRAVFGDSRLPLALQLSRGEIERPSLLADMPARFRRIVTRGLSVSPADRYPSMDALLEELGRDHGARRRRALFWTALALAVGMAMVAGGLVVEHNDQVCKGAFERLTGIWDPATKTRLGQAFTRADPSYGRASFDETSRVLDRYAASWVAMHNDACEATHIRGEQSEDMLDRRVGCLNDRRQELRAFASVLGKADANVVANAAKAAYDLERIERCAASSALAARVEPPQDSETRQQAESLRSQDAHLKALEITSQYQEGLGLAKVALAKAREVGYRPLRGLTSMRLGVFQRRLARYDAAKASLFDAYTDGLATGDDHLAAQSAVELVFVIGYAQSQLAEGLRWGRQAQAVIDRLDGEGELQATLTRYLGVVHNVAGDFPQAADHYRRALALEQAVHGEEHPHVASNLNNLGVALHDEGRYAEAIASYQKAVALWEGRLGPEHVLLTKSLNNMGLIFNARGDFQRAIEIHQRALRIRRARLGESHPLVAGSLNNLAVALSEMGEHDQSIAYHQKSLAIKREVLDDNHPEVGTSLCGMGDAYTAMGKYDEALVHLGRAHTIWSQELGSDHPMMGTVLTSLGEAYQGKGELVEARKRYERAMAICQTKTCEPEVLPRLYLGLGQVLWSSGSEQPRALE